ncbi:hypothetical protein AB0E69_18690 [Kribbella sp. NPDC026611]|uniref:hypothetical protein n=1 Tax=Kribbella sp. NPDC026611 TaxID=3154911 RepID=UPI0033F25415
MGHRRRRRSGGGLGFNVSAVSSPDALVSYHGSALPGLLELAPYRRLSRPSAP